MSSVYRTSTSDAHSANDFAGPLLITVAGVVVLLSCFRISLNGVGYRKMNLARVSRGAVLPLAVILSAGAQLSSGLRAAAAGELWRQDLEKGSDAAFEKSMTVGTLCENAVLVALSTGLLIGLCSEMPRTINTELAAKVGYAVVLAVVSAVPIFVHKDLVGAGDDAYFYFWGGAFAPMVLVFFIVMAYGFSLGWFHRWQSRTLDLSSQSTLALANAGDGVGLVGSTRISLQESATGQSPALYMPLPVKALGSRSPAC